MGSAFGWLDTDSEQRKKMLEVVDLFRESGTLDELGIGSIRDALSNALFPGTSTLHRRLRYVLFVPWLLRQAARKDTPDEMRGELRTLEIKLITSLLKGGEKEGVIGNTARDDLVQMPSSMYWSALGAWGIREVDSPGAYFRRQHDYRALSRRIAATDDPGAAQSSPSTGVDRDLPVAPADLLASATFTLTPDEEQYLSDKISRSTRGTMLAWLVRNPPQNRPDFVWDLDNLADAPEEGRELVDHAQRFSLAIQGATLLYNLLVAERARRDELAEAYATDMATWQGESDASGLLDTWDRERWWSTIQAQNPRVRGGLTQTFFNRWLDLAHTETTLARSEDARTLIEVRERQIKGGRARLANQAALDRWAGGGAGRLSFRWPVALSHLQDLYSARKAS